MFVSFFPRPKLFFWSLAVWTLFAVDAETRSFLPLREIAMWSSPGTVGQSDY